MLNFLTLSYLYSQLPLGKEDSLDILKWTLKLQMWNNITK